VRPLYRAAPGLRHQPADLLVGAIAGLKSIRHVLLPVCLLAAGIPVSAQNIKTEEEVVKLSPFEVTADGQIGYLANNSLAGTRINTSLRDIASSVQVVTKEFLDDTGATSLSELLIYTTSTEVAGMSGNASLQNLDSRTQRDEFVRFEPQFATRVRGLARVDLTRDYFLSDMDVDSYITSEVSINRGPNASLFGLGSPGGISNSAIDRADTKRSFGEINLRGDEYGSFRSSLNYNHVLLKDRVAVRVAVLNNEQRFEQEQAEYKERRYFMAATWRPLKDFAVRANYERGDGSGNRPVNRLPTDRISPWFANGKPSYNPLTQQWFLRGAQVTDAAMIAQLTAATQQFATLSANGNPALIFDNPNSPLPGNNGYAVIQPGLQADAAGRTATSLPVRAALFMRQFNGWTDLIARNPAYIVGGRPEISSAAAAYYNDVQLTDLSIFNSRKHSLSGPSGWQAQDFEVFSVRAEKTWLDNSLGLELAYQGQKYTADHSEPQTASSAGNLSVDINLVLLDGSPNPNYGRPFVGGRGFSFPRIRERESYQAVGFAKYDFAKKHDGWSKHFGNHVATAVFQSQDFDEVRPNRTNARASNTYNPSLARGGPGLAQAIDAATSPLVNNNTRATLVQYLGPSLVNASSIRDAQIQGATVPQLFQDTNNAMAWNPFNARFEKGSVVFYPTREYPEETWIFGNSRNRDKISSLSAVLQSKFLGGNLVSTLSGRRDAVTTYVANAERNPATGLYTGAEIPLGVPVYDDSVTQTSYGLVAHVPDKWLARKIGLSAHFVDSRNFSAGSAGVDFFNRPAPLQSGETKEYGISFSAFDGKFYMRANFYDTAQDWEKLTGVIPQIGDDITRVMENNTPAALAAAGWSLTDGSIFRPGTITALGIRPLNPNVPNNQTDWVADNIAGTRTNYFQSTSSTGMELEASYSPNSNWRIAVNLARAEVEVSDIMPIAGPELTRIAKEVYLDPKFGQLFINPSPIRQSDGTYANTDLLRSRSDNLLSGIALRKAREGGPLQEVRKWRWNLVTNYSFKGSAWAGSWLSKFSVGAAVRWQDRIAIGQGLKVVDGATIPDFDRQYYGPAETNVDAWITYNTRVLKDMALQLQLRVRNITSGSGDFIPVAANPDGEVALWRIGAPRSFELSARLKF
jgi:catecholate siderophore receptor